MEVLVLLQEILDCVKTRLRGCDLETVTLAVIRNLSTTPDVVAIFIRRHQPCSSAFFFTVVVEGRPNNPHECTALREKMDQGVKSLQRHYLPIQIYFSWELWPKWHRQNSLAGTIRI